MWLAQSSVPSQNFGGMFARPNLCCIQMDSRLYAPLVGSPRPKLKKNWATNHDQSEIQSTTPIDGSTNPECLRDPCPPSTRTHLDRVRNIRMGCLGSIALCRLYLLGAVLCNSPLGPTHTRRLGANTTPEYLLGINGITGCWSLYFCLFCR